MLDAKIVGESISRLRRKKNISQEVMSGLAGIGRTHLSAIERGDRKPTLETLYRISLALNMKMSEIVAEIENSLSK
ncbi:MAG: helix-turn-helix transcriptional regulator [Ruminococcus sp.]|nr:helix-turn-helix transcriptional regulator [Ruminococcus sp.]